LQFFACQGVAAATPDRFLTGWIMSTMLISPGEWAQNEFGFAQLGDRRRNRRLVNIAQHLAAHPGGTLPQVFPDWAELKAAYRFFGQAGVGFQQILAPHAERTRASCHAPGEYLIIEDTTLLDYSTHRATADLGTIGDGRSRGFELHSALAVRVTDWTLTQRPEGVVVGLLGQSCVRPRPAPEGESRRERLYRPRKSQRWAEVFKTAGRPPAGSQWIYVADRESDFYEPMQICQQHGVDFIIRSFNDRRLANQAGHLREALAQGVVLGETEVALRARPGQPARTARVELRRIQVDLDGPWRPGGWQPPLPGVTVIEVREVSVPETIPQPLHWRLLTSLPGTTWAQAQRIVGRYAARWWIEEYHKALKSGTEVEASQLENAHRLEALIAILAVVAVRLLNTKMLARSDPAGAQAAASFGPDLLKLLEKKYGAPKDGWTNQTVLTTIARLGGFLARKHDGLPGWQTIWRGWQRLSWMSEGANLIEN
jgi:hypothetical protein